MYSVHAVACRKLAGAFLALLLAQAVTACDRRERLAWIDRILVSDTDSTGARLEIDPSVLAAATHEVLSREERFGLLDPGDDPPGKEEPWTGRVELVYARTLPAPRAAALGAAPGGARADVAVELLLSRGAGFRLVGEGRATREFPLGDQEARTTAFRDAVQEAVARATQEIVLQLEFTRRSDGDLARDLASSDGRRRNLAMRILAERKSPLALPYLIEQLEEGDRSGQLRAIGGLVAVGDPRAVPALIQATLGRDTPFVVQVVYALGEIGGDEAEAYLFTAANGHPEEAVRRAAAEALEGLRAARKLRESRRTER